MTIAARCFMIYEEKPIDQFLSFYEIKKSIKEEFGYFIAKCA
jgi:hypothetical protein